MKKHLLLIAMVLFVVLMSVMDVFAQEGAAMDARNEAQDEAIEKTYEEMLSRDSAIMADLWELTLRVEALEGATPPPIPQPDGVKLQGGPWYISPFNIEEIFANLFHASPVTWRQSGGVTTQELFDAGVLNKKTGLPDGPIERTLTSDVFFTANDKTFYDGDWVLECDGDADLAVLFFPSSRVTKTGPCRYEFTRDAASGATPYHAAIQIKAVRSPVTALRLYRAENEQAIKSGNIYNPKFIDEIRKYHVVRSMDPQEANRAVIRDFDQLATLEACCWNNYEWQTGNQYPFSSMPLDAVVALAIEAENALWHHAPITLGAPATLEEIDLGNVSNPGERNNQISMLAFAQAKAQLAQGEWEEYAKGFVEALDRRDYKETTALYTTLANEVWNYSWQYQLTTIWASGVGGAYDRDLRFGYGLLLARYAMAMEDALRIAGRDQDITYVVEGQAANPSTTRSALAGVRAFIEARGEDWDEWSPKFGVSVASYWGGLPNWRSAGTVDEWRNPTPAFWARVENQILNGPADEVATLNWVLARFAEHEAEGARYGVKLIGAYEGGSHFEKPSEMPSEAYRAWHWGEAGGRVNAAVNDAIVGKFPNVILSNYVIAGPKGGQPWFEGPIGEENNTMIDSWKPYQKGN